jgi:hypothetical protein
MNGVCAGVFFSSEDIFEKQWDGAVDEMARRQRKYERCHEQWPAQHGHGPNSSSPACRPDIRAPGQDVAVSGRRCIVPELAVHRL